MDLSLLLTPQPPKEWQVPFFLVITVVTIIQMVRSRQPSSHEPPSPARHHFVFGASLAIVGLVLTLATALTDGPLAAYLVSAIALIGGVLYAGRGFLR